MHAAHSHSEAGVSRPAAPATANATNRPMQHADGAVGNAAGIAPAFGGASNGAATAAPLSAAGVDATAAASVIPFPFPFPPYPQQYQLMSHIFDTLQQGPGHVCIVESPTGTGKSLSLISSCLYWLLEHHPREQAAAAAAAAAAASAPDAGGTPGWVIAQHAELQAAASRKREADARLLQASITKQLQKRAEEEAAQRKRDAQTAARLGSTGSAAAAAAACDPDADLLPSDDTATSSSLSFAQQLELDDLVENQSDADKLLRELVLAPEVPQARKAQLILERQARAARIAALSGGGGGGGARATDAQVDELGSMLSRMLAGDRPRRKPQLIYASRTHSQLIQFVSEIKKTKYGKRLQQVRPNTLPASVASASPANRPAGGLPVGTGALPARALIPAPSSLHASFSGSGGTAGAAGLSVHELHNQATPGLEARVVSLGSRSNLCINPLVAHLKKQPLQLNDVCIDMQKNKPDSNGHVPKAVAISVDKNKLPTRAALTAAACPFLDPTSLELFHSESLARVYDLEQLPVLGAKLHFCSYYGSRNASPEADVIVVPYASLLSAHTRAALNIELRDAIIVVDEAHNLHDTINQLHSCTLSHTQLQRTLHALKLYRARFDKKLKPENLAALADLIAMCEGFMVAFLRGNAAARLQRSRENAVQGGGGGGPVRQLDDFIGSGIDSSMASASTTPSAPMEPGHAQAHAASKSSGLPPSIQRSLSSAGGVSDGAAHASRGGGGGGGGGGRVTYSLIKGSNSFLASLRLSDINPHRVQAWVEKQRMVHKIKGFLDRYHTGAGDGAEGEGPGGANSGSVSIHRRPSKHEAMGALPDSEYESSSLSPLAPVLDLIKALNNADSDGRICVDIVLDGGGEGGGGGVSSVHPKSSLRFLMLNPSVHMHPLLKECRTLILAGGTMRPFEAFRTQLFPALCAQTPQRLHEFACGHVVPHEHIQALIVRSGPTVSAPGSVVGGGGPAEPPAEFCFTHARRNDRTQWDSLAATIVNLLPLVPGGVVVFFTSYAFESDMLEYWATHENRNNKIFPSVEKAAAVGAAAVAAEESGPHVSFGTSTNGVSSSSTPAPAQRPTTWLEKMRARKCVFREPRSAGGVDHVLSNYTRIIEEAQAAAAATGSGVPAPNAHQAAAAQAQAQTKAPSRSHSASMQGDRYRLEAAAAARLAHAESTCTSGLSFTDARLRPSQTGALLFAVVGGKLSEGINFSDGLARCVVMVGLPYPNKHEASMKEKIAYLDAQEAEQRRQAQETATAAAAAAAATAAAPAQESTERSGMDVDAAAAAAAAPSVLPQVSPAPSRAPSIVPSFGRSGGGGGGGGNSSSAGSRYLHTLCMRAVNQSIGRAIRHRGDYASILLLDARYAGSDVVAGLPGWITQGPAFKPQGVQFAQARAALSAFFAFHKNRARKAAEAAEAAKATGNIPSAAVAPVPAAPHSSPSAAAAGGAVSRPFAHSVASSSAADWQRKRKPDEPAAPEQRPAKISSSSAASNPSRS